MMKLIIADDEQKVCQLIRGLIDWSALEMEVVGVAYNGIEALHLIESLRPDLVITDIRMPGYDGLEMIERARMLKSDVDFIIISGYRQFDYAQSAIKYGVSDYLLKPIKKDELTGTLRRMREKHRLRTEQLTEDERLKIRLKSDIDKLRAGLFADLLRDGDWEPASLGKLNEDYHFRFCAGRFQAFVVKIDCAYEDLHQGGLKLLEDKAEQILRETLEGDCFELEICFRGCRAYGLLNYAPERSGAVRREMKSAADALLLHNSLLPGASFSVGLGCAVDSAGELPASLRAAERAAQQRLADSAGKLLENAPPHDPAYREDALLADFSKQLDAALEMLDPAGAAAAAAALCERALSLALPGQELFHLAAGACGAFLVVLRNLRLDVGDADELQARFLRRADLCASARLLFDCLEQEIFESADRILQERSQADKKPIRDAKQYIQQHYMDSISLEEVSGVVGFNAAYFSSLFKKESGQNFLEYLSEVRMEKAKELLKETNLNIAAICGQVGYTDLRHFTQMFKKYTALKPNEFRKLYA